MQGKGRNKLSLSLKRLFSSSSRRDSSSGQANEVSTGITSLQG